MAARPAELLAGAVAPCQLGHCPEEQRGQKDGSCGRPRITGGTPGGHPSNEGLLESSWSGSVAGAAWLGPEMGCAGSTEETRASPSRCCDGQ
ncbi:Serine Protease 27 [Manis pentadactyla]|nr:Serine Protease 27 [Manis pentadactyla]